MSTSASKKDIPAFWVLVMIVIGVYLLYLIVRLLVRSFVFFGYNGFFFTDNMLQIRSWNPVVVWSVLGIFIGAVIGVWLAIKKFHLPKILVLYPVLTLLLFVTIMCFINAPDEYDTSYEVTQAPVLQPETPTETNTLKYYYKAVSDVSVRSGPSTNDGKLFVLYKGATVEMVKRYYLDERRNEWMKIKYNGQEGYVRLKFLRYVRLSAY